MVQRLRLCAFTTRGMHWFLVRELRSCMLHCVAKKNKCLQGQEFLFHLLI